MNERLLDAAALRPGLRVLDLACGAGTPALDEARRVAPGGSVVGVDLADAQLALARRFAEVEGVKNVEFRQADALDLPFEEVSFDRVTSRFGPMFFPDLGRSLREARRVLRPGGHLAWMVWGRIEDQPFFASTILLAAKRVGLTELPSEARRPFCFADGGILEGALAQAGFDQPREERHTVPVVWAATPEVVSDFFWRSVAPPFQGIANRLSESDRAEMVGLSAERFRAAYSSGEVRLSASVIVARGTKPNGPGPPGATPVPERGRESQPRSSNPRP